MAISKRMRKALRALSYIEPGAERYKAERFLQTVAHPSLPPRCFMWEHSVFSWDGYEVPLRMYYPKAVRSEEILLFFHGGGWVSGTIDSYGGTCAALAKAVGRRVCSVDYRLAPEYPFPNGLEDCYAAAKEFILNSGMFQKEAPPIILMGDSAGGNLAAAVSLLAAHRKEFRVKKQILLYPAVYYMYTNASPFPSVKENGEGYLLTSKKIQKYMELYSPEPAARKNPYIAPILAEDLSGQPETLIITAEYDPLRDEGEAYGAKLKKAGCSVWVERFPDTLHGFFTLPVRFSPVRRCHRMIRNFLDGTMEDMQHGETTSAPLEKTR